MRKRERTSGPDQILRQAAGAAIRDASGGAAPSLLAPPTLKRKGSSWGVKRRRVPSASTASSPSSCRVLDIVPHAMLLPCDPVATAPATVWYTNHGNAGSVQPA
jgi:hypothetical protein